MQPYFTVAEAMQRLATVGRLGAATTAGRRWIALETREQMETTLRSSVDRDGNTHFPWQVRMARAATLTGSLHGANIFGNDGSSADLLLVDKQSAKAAPASASASARSPSAPSRRLVLPLSTEGGVEEAVSSPKLSGGGQQPTFLPSSAHAQIDFVLLPSSPTRGGALPVPGSDDAFASPLAERFESAPSADSAGWGWGSRSRIGALAQPLLSGLSSAYYASGAAGATVYDADDGFSIYDAQIEAPEVRASVGLVGSDMQALSIDLRRKGIHDASYAATSREECYLIELPSVASAGTAPVPPRRWLALPSPVADDATPYVCGLPAPALPLLPPSIDSVTLTETKEDTVAVTVTKTVPLAGWLLLAAALLTCYSGAPVTDLQREAMPVEGTTFLRSAWRGTVGALASGLCACCYDTSRKHLCAALLMRLDRPVALKLLASGLAFVVNFGMFNLSLEHTSISHAALFESCSSLYIVIGRLLASAVGRGAGVPKAHIFAVILGGGGALFAMRDAPPADGAPGTPVSLLGDCMALLSGLGASIYLSLAEALRIDVDALAFFALVMGQFGIACFTLAYLFDDAPPSLSSPFDPQHGVLGWIDPSPARLGTQLWLALIVDLAGNFGFIAVMAYVPALTVAAVMLLGPLTSCLEGIAVGVDQLPGPWTLVGSILITAGSGIISFSTSERTATVEITTRS